MLEIRKSESRTLSGYSPMNRNNYQRLHVYDESLTLAKDITRALHNMRPFRLSEQIIASAVSIPSNIAEGSQMNTPIHFIKFLTHASGSAAELHTQLLIIKEIIETDSEEINSWIIKTLEIQSMIRGLMKHLNQTKHTG